MSETRPSPGSNGTDGGRQSLLPDFVHREDYCVLILEQSDLLGSLFERWLEPIPTRCVDSLDDLPTHLDPTVSVALLSQSALGDAQSATRNGILRANPFCQLVVIQSRGEFVTIHDDSYDDSIQRPVFRDDLQSVVELRLLYSVYGSLLHQFYTENSRLLAMERTRTTDDTVPDTDTVWERYQRVCAKLGVLQRTIDQDDIDAIQRSIGLHRRFLRTPERMDSTDGKSKYHPQRCPNCKLPWGRDHGNELRSGFVTVAAHVRKCTRCDTIVHGLGSGHRRVMGA